jgi:hypothetical protein
MGQATLDLPDPLEQPPATAAGTDDLLAQLAGEEIDRLLAESESDLPPEKMPQDSTAAQESLLPPESAPPAVQSDIAKPQTQLTPAAQLDSYLGEIATTSAAGATEADSVTQFAQNPVSASPKPEAGTGRARHLDDDEMLAAERGALNSVSADAASVETALSAVETTLAARESEPKIPLYLRLLAGLSAPLNSSSDKTRELIGKIAILTMVNAISVLIYVLFFRKHG